MSSKTQDEIVNRRAQLSPTKRALLEKRRAGRARIEAEEQVIRPSPRHGPPPLSFAQQRLWFLDQLEPGLVAYNVPAAVRLVGRLDVEVLNWSLNEIVRRHESLRTTFNSVAGQPVQVIAPALELSVPIVELTDLPDDTRETEALRRSQEEAQRPFDLLRGPLIRAVLLRLRSDEHVLILTMHHIVSDGWSQGVLRTELGTLYEAGMKGERSPLPELSIQYADFAQWQRGWLTDAELERQIAYWRDHLKGAPPSVDLPTDGARAAQMNYRGATFLFELSAELSESLTALSRREGATLFMTLLAAFNALLSRYTDQSDIVIGTPVANRNREELEPLIGFFVNTLALRTDCSRNPTFRELLHRVREVSLGAYPHQDLPFELLVEALEPVRDLSRNPIFQIAFDLQSTPAVPLELTGLTLQPHEFTSETTRFDLELHLTSTPEGLLGAVVYSTNLFAESTVHRLAERYRMLLEAIVADPEQRVSDIELLTAAERRQLLVQSSDIARSIPDERCIPDLFEAWATRAPDRIALAFGAERVTYEELNRRANQLAHYLQTYGAVEETRIGIFIERSVEMIVAVLGVIKAGATYVPLEPSSPQQRLLFMLEDAEVQLVLSVSTLEDKLPAHRAPLILLDSDLPSIEQQSQQNPARNVTPEHLAYIVYTSGSTGTPKGVAVPHRGVVRLVVDNDYANFGADEVFLQFAPLAFDASTFEIWGSLLNGAQLVLMPSGVASLADLGRALAQYGVTTLWLTAGLFHQMVDEQLEALAGVRQLLAGGDVLSPSHVKKFLTAARGSRLINGYGPTENTTFTCCHVMDQPLDFGGSVPIGRPIVNTQVFILDRNLRLCPPGCAGELYAAGAGLARGYQAHASLTAERFIPHPFASEPGARLYRTGDVARYRDDGNIEFIGRADDQVKVRGYRIEPGEVETALRRASGVRQVAVVVRDYGAGDKRLVAYVVGDVSVDVLQKSLRTTLPDYMIPSAFVVLDQLPLTPNGKVDRRALPAPDDVHAPSDAAATAPRTPVEEILAGIWTDVLKVERVGVDDDFFELGGHSLLVTRLVSRAQAHFGAELPLKLFFESPTLAAQAAQVEAALRTESGLHAPPIVSVPRAGNLPLSFSQQRLWFLYQLEPSTSAYNIPTAVRLKGSLDRDALRRTLNEVVRRHEILRTYYGMADGQPAQFVGPPPDLKIELIDLDGLAEAERESRMLELAEEEARKPFDLTRAPLLRASLVRLGPDEHVLLLTVHHIVSDGWSQGVLVREVGKLYQAFSDGKNSPLEELPVQYADFAHWQRNWLDGDVLDQHLAYWRQQLAGDLPVLDLPTDWPRPEVQSFRGATLTTTLPPGLSEALGVICRHEGVTLFMLLLAAFKALLSRYTGQDEIVIGAPIANRNNIQTENLIGFFVNTLVLRTNLSGDPHFTDLLTRVRKVTLEAYAHQDLPFEVLVEDLQPERSLSRNPLFQVMFQLENTPKEELPLPGLTLSPVSVAGVASQFDLSVDVVESDHGLRVTAEYSTDLFKAETIRNLLKRWQILLESIAAAPDQRVSELPLMDQSERLQLELDWNQTAKAFPSQSVVELFEAQVARSPSAVAVMSEGESLTFAELDRRATRLAHYLWSTGVGPEVPVAVSLGSSVEMVVALVGILKAGGAYVALDPSYPQSRLAFMLEDVGARLVLTQESVREAMAITAAQTKNTERRLDLENAAYVIYTSGSTGTPKGVVITHRGLANHCLAVAHEYELRASDRVLQFASLSFDVAAEEIFPTLLAGAAIVLQRERVLEPTALLRLIEQEQVSVLNMSAGFWQQWLEGLESKGARLPPCVRLTVTGSEKVTAEGVALWQRLAPANSVLMNAYGVSEATITSTLYRHKMDVSGTESLPIGRPIANVQAYVLDRNLHSVPISLAGELYLAGEGLARGYHGNPRLTAERFIPHPFSTTPGARLYRTGDLARYRVDGNLEFIGRVDEQIKLRGYRIELGEIETVLNSAPGVRRAAVLLRAGASGHPALVAYVTPKPIEESPTPELATLETEQLTQWRTVHDDEVFNENALVHDPSFNISGWNSSYTGEPISAEEMREWVDDAVQRVLSQRPRRVLEIGCGTGLLLFRIAPHCERYLGTDFSPAALNYIREQLQKPGNALPQVSLSEQNADDFTNVEPSSFDAVIVNSVVQYFPGVDYLMRVLRGAVEALAPGGFIVIGDVRSLPLLKALHTSIEHHKAEDACSAEQLRQRIERRMEQEEELLIDPAFFTELKQHLPKISHVEVEPKRGRYHNELTRFRYQVMLRAGEQKIAAVEDLSWIDWRKDRWDLSELRRRLVENKPETLALTNVSNARLGDGIDPEDLYRLGDELPYRVHLSWARHGADGSFDVAFTQSSHAVYFPSEPATEKSLNDYVNHPLRGKQARQLGPQLRSFLKVRLPEQMVPASFVILDELPLLPNGKIDRRALPAPEAARPDLPHAFVAPRTPVERALAGVWSDLLGLPQVGINDNFFDLGGHSLLATQLISRVRDLFQVELPLRQVFQQPTIAALAVAIEHLRQDVHDLPGGQDNSVNHANRVILSRTISKSDVFVFPLSFAQQRLWFLHQMEPSTAAYNMPLAFRLTGLLDLAALQWSLNEIVRRHEILRTTFDVLDEEPVQVIAATGELTLSVTDSVSEAEAEMLASKEAQQPFDLVRGPLIRSMLMRLATDEHVLLVTMHHIIGDGWSQTVLLNELDALYEAAVAGRSSPLPELSIQYGDFAEWQREWLQGEVLDQQLDYWRKHLTGAPPSLELPTDRPRPTVQSFNGARHSFALSRDLSARLLQLSRRQDATLFMTLLAAFYVLLYRYSGETDIVIGTPVANRNRQELESLIGFFVNTLALRANLSGDPTFSELLAQVREISLGAYAHQDLPFEMLVEELSPIRDPGRNPIFQVMFALQNVPEAASPSQGLVINPVEVKTARAQFDLILDVIDLAGQFHLTFVYNTDLFEAATIQRMAAHFKVLLAGVSTGQTVGALPLLTAAELQQLLVEWNDTAKELQGELCIHRLFEQQAERVPEAIALVFEDRRMTYGELNQRANKLANYLLESGVGPESFVGLMLERSPEMIVTLLAILKAGGAYVPLDPSAPPARLSYMLDDAGISVLVTDRRLANELSLAKRLRVICIDDEKISKLSHRNLSGSTSGDTAVYVTYTSGSTGPPKGVVITHRSLCNVVAAFVESFAVRPESCVLQFATLSFDAAMEEIFTALTTGARLCLVSRETLLSGRQLVEYAQQHEVTVATLPPSMLAVLSPDEFPMLETVVAAGERCPAETAARWSRGKRFINGYGPTEATIGCILYEHDGAYTGDPPIGRPITNTRIYLLDQRLNPVPVGVSGELYIGGVGVARGYLGRAALTAEKFIPDPFSTEPGARLYQTGDMARYLPDGNIKFAGRRDEQLKIRGMRIEPGEIEATLKEHAAVAEAAVIADEDRNLVAYVAAKPGAGVTAEELRAFARQRLPDYMMPSFFALLDQLPLTPNIKVDRIALRGMVRTQFERVAQRIAPRDLLESQLARIWEELLHVEPGVRDNFFELGGHSLLVVPLLARVEQLTGKRLNVAAVFTAPTIESLASILRDGDEHSPRASLIPIQPRGSMTPVFFVHPAGGSIAGYFALARALGLERPLYAFEGTSAGIAERQVELIAANYVEAIRAVQREGPYLLGGWSTGGIVAFEIARQLQARGADVALVALLDSLAPGDHHVYDDLELLAGFAVNVGVPNDLVYTAPEELLRSGTQAQLSWVLDQARRGQHLPPDVSADDLRHRFELYLADVQAVKNYRPAAASIPLLLLRAEEERDDPETTAHWRRLCSGNLEPHNVPGDHLTMMRAPHVSTLAKVLSERFARVEDSKRSVRNGNSLT